MGSLFKPKITGQSALPPAANPPVFANIYSSIAGNTANQKKKPPKPSDAGFGDDGGKTANQALAKPVTTATPSLLG